MEEGENQLHELSSDFYMYHGVFCECWCKKWSKIILAAQCEKRYFLYRHVSESLKRRICEKDVETL